MTACSNINNPRLPHFESINACEIITQVSNHGRVYGVNSSVIGDNSSVNSKNDLESDDDKEDDDGMDSSE